jgi:hypothetical protein
MSDVYSRAVVSEQGSQPKLLLDHNKQRISGFTRRVYTLLAAKDVSNAAVQAACA